MRKVLDRMVGDPFFEKLEHFLKVRSLHENGIIKGTQVGSKFWPHFEKPNSIEDGWASVHASFRALEYQAGANGDAARRS